MNLRQVIKDIQSWLLYEGRCTGCGQLLADGKHEIDGGQEIIICDCSRVYSYNNQLKVYERTQDQSFDYRSEVTS